MSSAAERAERLRRLSPEQREALLRALREDAPAAPAPIPRREGSGPAPLSFAQQRLWLIERVRPGGSAYNVPVGLGLSGRLDRSALRRAVREIARRHEVLRSRIALHGETPLQEPVPGALPAPSLVDLGALAEPARSAELARRSGAEARRPFDLARAPLVRALLFRLGAERHVLLVTMHHVVSDGWSDSVLVRELAALYAAYAAGRPSPLPEPRIQYADFAAWQGGELRGERHERLLAWWRERLAGAPPSIDLPTDRPRPAERSVRGATRTFAVPAERVATLGRLAGERGATPFMVLLAGFAALLARVCGQRDLVIGSPVAARPRPELEELIGFFVNSLALRVRVTPGTSFRELLSQVYETALGAFEHQDLPFEKLVEDLRVPRDPSRAPLFQVMLAVQNAGGGTLELPGLAIDPMPPEPATTKLDLTLAFDPAGGELRGTAEYARDVFDPVTVERLVRQLGRLLAGAEAAPDAPIAALPLLGRAERHALVHEHGAARPVPVRAPASLYGRFAAWAERAPDAVAAVSDRGCLSYRGLDLRARALADRLCALGVAPGDAVGLSVGRSLDLVVGVLAILRAGGCYVPLDPAYPAPRLAWMAEDAGVVALVADERGAAALAASSGAGVPVASPAPGSAEAPVPPAPEAAAAPVPAEAAAYVIYTSGSTGRPKGVPVSHANVLRLLDATDAWFEPGPDDGWTLFHSASFDFSVWELWGALAHGGRLVVVGDEDRLDPARFLRLLARERTTVLNQTPSAFAGLVRADEAEGTGDPLALRTVVFGGEALEPGRLRSWVARHGDRRPRLVNMYGITETTVHVTYRPIDAADVEAGAGSPLGAAIPDLALHVVEPGPDAGLEPAPLGVAGEILVGGAGLARGYLGRPALTAERFGPDPFGASPGERVYRTGDLARRSGRGELLYLGRIDHQVKVRGFRIELGEIEAVLASHPQVAQAVVVAHPDEAGDSRLAAYAVGAGGEAPAGAELRAYLAERLPDHMVPAFLATLPELPLTENGKLDRARLPLPDGDRPDLVRPYAPPCSPEEEVLVEVWREVVGVDRVGIDDDFFALGGDSMRTVQVQVRLRERGWSFPLRDIYAHPTVRELAPRLERQETAGATEETGEGEAGAAAASAADAGLLDLLDEVEALPDEVLREQLARRGEAVEDGAE